MAPCGCLVALLLCCPLALLIYCPLRLLLCRPGTGLLMWVWLFGRASVKKRALGFDFMLQLRANAPVREIGVKAHIVLFQVTHELPGEKIEYFQYDRGGVLLCRDDPLESLAQMAHVHR